MRYEMNEGYVPVIVFVLNNLVFSNGIVPEVVLHLTTLVKAFILIFLIFHFYIRIILVIIALNVAISAYTGCKKIRSTNFEGKWMTLKQGAFRKRY